jgi:hypothetical protein
MCRHDRANPLNRLGRASSAVAESAIFLPSLAPAKTPPEAGQVVKHWSTQRILLGLSS